MGMFSRLVHSAWNVFNDWNQNQQMKEAYSGGATYGPRPDRTRMMFSHDRSIVSAILTRIAVDTASIEISHVRNDSDGKYQDDILSGLNNCLTIQANIDQFAQQFRQDIFMTLFDKGVVAIVPVDTTSTPINSNAYDVVTMRVGEVVGWHPGSVRISLFNQEAGYRQQVELPKSMVAVVENPFYQIMNEPNSTLQRLIRKLNMLDAVDEASSSGKLDLIIQLPYVVRSDARRTQAAQRLADIEFQLKGSKHGIAYSDGTEKITQLNRPVTNNLMDQVTYLTQMLYDQLGLTDTIMNGTADEATMNNYYTRTVEPILRSVVEAMKATFLSTTARTQGQSLTYFRDPFAFIPMSEFAKIADMLSRNEIASANDLRVAIGWKPSKDPKADKLNNSNMPTPPPVQPDTKAPFPQSDRMPATRPLPSQYPSQLTRTGGNSQNGT